MLPHTRSHTAFPTASHHLNTGYTATSHPRMVPNTVMAAAMVPITVVAASSSHPNMGLMAKRSPMATARRCKCGCNLPGLYEVTHLSPVQGQHAGSAQPPHQSPALSGLHTARRGRRCAILIHQHPSLSAKCLLCSYQTIWIMQSIVLNAGLDGINSICSRSTRFLSNISSTNGMGCVAEPHALPMLPRYRSVGHTS